ncbi:MAG: TonB-dependent receptor [Bryobacterales bacterium]|nr:TonB-dependent receptor [Bryobacterales bacterium]
MSNSTVRFPLNAVLCLIFAVIPYVVFAQETGAIRGVVTIVRSGSPLHEALITVPRLRRVFVTDAEGRFEIPAIPAGSYDLVAHLGELSDLRKTVVVVAGQTTEVNFEMSIRPVREHITVTATGTPATAQEVLQPVTSLESTELVTRLSPSLGGALDHIPGVNRRSFGPGNDRPVIRGFDGDRVLIMQDGIRTGTVSSSSGDHGEPLNVASAERVEIIRGPATLLYGSNAIGGVVNMVGFGNHLHQHKHETLSGNLTFASGTTNGLAAGSGGFEFGKNGWLLWGGGGGQRTSDYNTPQGRIDNSATDSRNSYGGFGKYGEKAYFNFEYNYGEGNYGVPFAAEFHGHHHDDDDDHHDERRVSALQKRSSLIRRSEDDHDDHEDHHDEEHISIGWRRHNVRSEFGLTKMPGFAENFRLVMNYSDWNHRELEGDEIGTEFFNKQFVYRGTFDQKRRGALHGSFGFWGMQRDFEARGIEALAPPTTQNAVAVFALEELDYERVKFQFGGRLEHNRYRPLGLQERNFTAFSGSTGFAVPLPEGFTFAASYSHSSRAPALEELYNNGPHIGNLTYEVGNPNLKVERGNGAEVSLRRLTPRFHTEANFFYYNFSNFVFLAPTGETDDGLPVADFTQANSRFYGFDGRVDFETVRNVWVKLGVDTVNARLTSLNTGLPRIPPARARLGLDFRPGRLSIQPELAMGSRQSSTYFEETETPGYAVVNVRASYSIPTQHATHIFSADAFNLGDRLWRNHLSFIKDLAPEIGRGIRFGYSLRFF